MKAEIRLLGPGSARRNDGVPVDSTAWRTAKTYDLMRVLALTPGRPVAVATLLDVFWPSSDPAHASTSLRTATSHIRKALGCTSVVRVGHGLVLEASVDVSDYRDVAVQVEKARRRGSWERVLHLVDRAESLYEGDLEVAGSECSLLHEARRDLMSLRVRLLLEAAEAAGECADWRRSLELAQRAAAVEGSDRSTRAIMRAWFGLGEMGELVEEFERLRARLADDYGVDPAPQTRMLYLELIGSCDEWPPRESVVGRQGEIRKVVTAALDWMAQSREPSGVIWLLGQPGSGRGAIAKEAARTLLHLCDSTGGSIVEVLPDQGVPTHGTAEMLRRRATAVDRILLVPAVEAAPLVLGPDDAIVRVPPLDYPEFARLMSVVLQRRPDDYLVDQIYAESRGLPGAACRMVRQRARTDDLVWDPQGVGLASRRSRLAGAMPALASWPFVLLGALGAFGAAGSAEPTPAESMVVELRAQSSTGAAVLRSSAGARPAWSAVG